MPIDCIDLSFLPLRRSRLAGSLLALALAAGAHGLPAFAQDSEALSKIEVVGAKKASPETVIYKSGLKVGDDLRAVDFSAVVEKLWASGIYDDVKLEVQEGKDGKVLVIRVVERPVVREVDYRGGTEVGLTGLKDKIKEKKLTLPESSVYDPEAARKIKSLIVDQCAEKGFRNPVVDVQLEPLGPGVARLVFDIKEGAKVRIYKVAFRGNTVFSSAKLQRLMEKTREHWMFSWLTSHDLLVKANLDEDLKAIKKAYWREGYKDVFVGQPTIQVDDRTTERQKRKNVKRVAELKSPKYDLRATLTVPILEGERFYEGTFKVEGNDKVFKGAKGAEFYRYKIGQVRRDNRSLVAKLLDLKPSEEDLPGEKKKRVFDLDGLNEGVDKIAEDHRNLGYVAFHADKKMEVREADGVKKVDVVLKVDEGEQFTIRRINIEGNTTTKDKVIRRSLPMREGDVFRMEALKDAYTGIGQLGFFDVKGNEPKIDPVGDKPQVDVTFKGEEAGVNELLFNGGYGSLFGFSLGVSFSTKNLGGGGETLAFSYNGGKYQRYASVSFTEPWVFDQPYSVGASIANGNTDYDADRVGKANAYEQHTKSLGVSVGTKLSTFFPESRWAFFTSYSVGYNFRIIRIEGGRSYYFRDNREQLTSTLNQTLSYNTVNHPFKPTDGFRATASLEYGGWQFGGDRPFIRTSFEMAKFASLAERHIFAANVSYGYIRNLSESPLATWELYRPGGENNIRGYRYGQVGSVMYDTSGYPVVVGGNKQFLANLEYQFKIADQFRTVLFYDMGNAWGPGHKVFSESPRRSVGLELRFFLPISPAPMRLIWARKLNPYAFDTDGKSDFQFSIGTTF